MGDSFFEYGGVDARRFELWENVLQDVGPPMDDRPSRQARQAIEQLWPHLEALHRLVDSADARVAVHLESIDRSIARVDEKNRKHGSAALDLVHAVQAIERLLLGLIGPQGQSPAAPRSVEIPVTPLFEAWLFLATGCANLAPSPAATQTIRWQQTRAFLRPAQVKAVAAAEIRDVSVEACSALVEQWKMITPGLGRPSTPGLENRFRHVVSGLQSDLKAFASRGEAYIGWTAWYGHE